MLYYNALPAVLRAYRSPAFSGNIITHQRAEDKVISAIAVSQDPAKIASELVRFGGGVVDCKAQSPLYSLVVSSGLVQCDVSSDLRNPPETEDQIQSAGARVPVFGLTRHRQDLYRAHFRQGAELSRRKKR